MILKKLEDVIEDFMVFNSFEAENFEDSDLQGSIFPGIAFFLLIIFPFSENHFKILRISMRAFFYVVRSRVLCAWTRSFLHLAHLISLKMN